MKKLIKIIEERDGWKWTIQAQNGELSDGVEIVYEDHNDTNITTLGTLADAFALSQAIRVYCEELAKRD